MTKRCLALLLLCLMPAASQAAAPPGGTPTLTGMVTDSDGRAVAGVSLWALSSSEPWLVSPSAVSGPDGSFAILGLPPGAVELYACGNGYVHDIRTVWYRDEPVHLELRSAATLRGRILGPDGEPVAGADVYPREVPMILLEDDCIFSSFPESSPPCPSARSATSDADGHFELASLLPGRYRFDISADGLTTDELYPMQLSEGDVVEGLEIRLRSTGSREGRLIDPAGAPPDSANVTLSDEEGEFYTAYVSGGTFRFIPRAAGPITFQVKAEGYEILERTIDPAADAEPVELVLVRDESWKTIRGRVVGLDGKPIEGAEIYAAEGITARSAADGSFELQLSLRKLQPIEISKDGFAFVRLDLDPETPPAEKITIRLEPGATVTGRLLGLTPGDRGLDARVTLRSAAGQSLDTPLRADDTFRFEHVPTGAWKLTLKTRYRSVMKRVIVKPGQTEIAVDLSLPPRTLVSGRVLDSQGRPIAGAELFASQDDEPVAAGGTRDDGSFDLHVPRGDIQLHAIHPSFLDGWLEISVGKRPVRRRVIRLEPEPSTHAAGRLLGLVPSQKAEIVGILDEPTITRYSRARFEEDSYEIYLRPGSWILQGFLYDAAGTFLRSIRWTVDVPPGETEKLLDLDLANAEELP